MIKRFTDKDLIIHSDVAKALLSSIKKLSNELYCRLKYKEIALQEKNNPTKKELLDDYIIQAGLVLLDYCTSDNKKTTDTTELSNKMMHFISHAYSYGDNTEHYYYWNTFLKLYTEGEAQKNKFNVNGFIAYNLFDCYRKDELDNLTKDNYDFIYNKHSTLTPPNVAGLNDFASILFGTRIHGGLDHIKRNKKINEILKNELYFTKDKYHYHYEAIPNMFFNLTNDIMHDIRYLNKFVNKIYTELFNIQYNDYSTSSGYFLKYKDVYLFDHIYKVIVEEEYVGKIFLNKKWLSERISSLIRKLIKNGYIIDTNEWNVPEVHAKSFLTLGSYNTVSGKILKLNIDKIKNDVATVHMLNKL